MVEQQPSKLPAWVRFLLPLSLLFSKVQFSRVKLLPKKSRRKRKNSMKFPRKYHALASASSTLTQINSEKLPYPTRFRTGLTPTPWFSRDWRSSTEVRQAVLAYKVKLNSCRKLRKNLRLPIKVKSRKAKKRRKKSTLRSSQKAKVRQSRSEGKEWLFAWSEYFERRPRRFNRTLRRKLLTARRTQHAAHSHTVYHPGTAEQHLGFFSVQHPEPITSLFSTWHSPILLPSLNQGFASSAQCTPFICVNDFAWCSNRTVPSYSLHTTNLAYGWLSFERYPLPTLTTFSTQIASNRSITFRPQFFNYSRNQIMISKFGQTPTLPKSRTLGEIYRNEDLVVWSCEKSAGSKLNLLGLSQKALSSRSARDLVTAVGGNGHLYQAFVKQFFISSRKNFYVYSLLPEQLYSHLNIRVDRMTPQCRQRLYVKPLKRLAAHQVRGLSGALYYTYASDGNEHSLEAACGVALTVKARSAYVGSLLGFVSTVTALAADSNVGDIFFHRNVGPGHRKQKSLIYRKPNLLGHSSDIIGSRQLFLENNFWNKYLHSSPLVFKYIFWTSSNTQSFIQGLIIPGQLKANLADHFRFNFSTRRSLYHLTNLWPTPAFSHTTKRRFIKMITFYKFLPRTFIWWNDTLIRFMEHHSGRRVYLKLNSFIENSLPYVDLARCSLWFERVLPWQRVLGHRIFVQESLRIFHLAIRFRDPTFLCNWLKGMLYRLSFWKYRVLFRYVKFVMRNLFFIYFDDLGFKGLKLRLKGKVSVAGNARTRTLVYRIGETGHATVNNRVLSEFTTVESFTGVMGFRVSIYF